MQIVVNHLTRMQAGYVCVAGIDPESGQHVRPILRGQRLQTSLLARNGGPFDMAVVVDLGQVTPNPQAPELEDHVFDPSRARALTTRTPTQFWRLLRRTARTTLREIFGEELTQRGARSCGVDVGTGSASLGCLALPNRSRLYLQSRAGRTDQIRMQLTDGEFNLDLGVTDIRLYEADHVTPAPRAVQQTARRMENGQAVILGVGLTRPFASPGFTPIHWLQVNNIHLEANPCSQLG